MATLDKEDAKLIADAFLDSMKEFTKQIQPPDDMKRELYTPQLVEGVVAKFNYVIPAGSLEFTSEKKECLQDAHIVSTLLVSPVSTKVRLKTVELNDDGSVTFKFKEKTLEPIAYRITFSK